LGAPAGVGITIMGAAGWSSDTTTIIDNTSNFLLYFNPRYGAPSHVFRS
jgi:hypothetical protein